MPATASPYDQTKELTEKLEDGMKELFSGDKYKAYLAAMSHFHNYSTRNIMLIKQQMPDATRIASYNTWKDLNRQVKKGEKGLKIFAPINSKPQTVISPQKHGFGGDFCFGDIEQPPSLWYTWAGSKTNCQ